MYRKLASATWMASAADMLLSAISSRGQNAQGAKLLFDEGTVEAPDRSCLPQQ
jgi:hypothetical protein